MHITKKDVKQILFNYSFYVNSVKKDLANNDRCIISTKYKLKFMVTFRTTIIEEIISEEMREILNQIVIDQSMDLFYQTMKISEKFR